MDWSEKEICKRGGVVMTLPIEKWTPDYAALIWECYQEAALNGDIENLLKYRDAYRQWDDLQEVV